MLQAEGPSVSCEETLHILPCHIDYEGQANVEEYLIISQENSSSPLATSFRGRRLEGDVMQLPGGLKGELINDSAIVGSFKNVISWNADEIENTNKLKDMLDIVQSHCQLFCD